jgi:hypothetical protein
LPNGGGDRFARDAACREPVFGDDLHRAFAAGDPECEDYLEFSIERVEVNPDLLELADYKMSELG